MPCIRQISVLATVLIVCSAMPARVVWSAPNATDATLKAVQDLDNAALFAERHVHSRCGDDQGGIDLEAEAWALSAAYIHMHRMERVKGLNASTEELVPVALQAAADFRRAYACNRTVVRNLDLAIRLLTSTQASLPDDATNARENVDDALTELLALKEARTGPQSVPRRLSPPPPPRPGPKVNKVSTIVMNAGTVSFKTPLSDSYLGRLSLRLDLGFGKAFLPTDSDIRSSHRGLYFRTHLLARFTLSSQRRFIILLGPYYNLLSALEPSPVLGDALMHGVGAHFELAWRPRRMEPWVSIHPFLNAGLEYIQLYVRPRRSFAGFQVGGGASICLWHESICPNIRIMPTPGLGDKKRPSIQAGVAFDVLRWVDLGLSRRHTRKRSGDNRTRSVHDGRSR